MSKFNMRKLYSISQLSLLVDQYFQAVIQCLQGADYTSSNLSGVPVPKLMLVIKSELLDFSAADQLFRYFAQFLAIKFLVLYVALIATEAAEYESNSTLTTYYDASISYSG